MANDLSRMKTDVRAWTDTTETRLSDEQLTGIVNGIIADLSRSADSLYNEFSEAITTVSGTGTYEISSTLANKFSRPFSMWLIDSAGLASRVTYVPPEEFEKRYFGSNGTGSPVHYTIFAGYIYFGPTPDAEYSLRFRYYGYPADLVSNTDTNKYLANAWDVVFYGTLGEVCLYLIEDNRKATFSAEYKTRKIHFLIEQGRARTSGRRPESHEPGWLED
jgi:hypothetical protein